MQKFQATLSGDAHNFSPVLVSMNDLLEKVLELKKWNEKWMFISYKLVLGALVITYTEGKRKLATHFY